MLVQSLDGQGPFRRDPGPAREPIGRGRDLAEHMERVVARARRLGAFIEFHNSPDYRKPGVMEQANELLHEHGADIRSVPEFWA